MMMFKNENIEIFKVPCFKMNECCTLVEHLTNIKIYELILPWFIFPKLACLENDDKTVEFSLKHISKLRIQKFMVKHLQICYASLTERKEASLIIVKDMPTWFLQKYIVKLSY